MALCAAITAVAYVFSLITRNVSQVDRLWSITPMLYAGVFAGMSGFSNTRVNLMFALILAWSARLTFNYARKGGYRSGSEDYRWSALRKRMPAAAFQLFNLLFIAIFQNVLLLLITLPAWVASKSETASLGPIDLLIALLFVLAIVGESIADNQQWRFHLLKQSKQTTAHFLTAGLFRFSRHPNFFCEQLMWWCVFAFSVLAAGTPWHVGLAGPVILTALFQGSSRFTEALTLEKYPAYAEYQRTTPRQFPVPRW